MTRYTLEELKTAAHGRWPEIHAALGIPNQLLNTGRHQPCPHCGGKDRFRYTDYRGSGGFICNQCTPQGGSGFDLLMLVFGYSFSEAADAVAGVLGLSDRAAVPITPITAVQGSTGAQTDKQAALLSLLDNSARIGERSAAGRYLVGRGLDWAAVSDGLQGLHDAELVYWHDGQDLGRYPAMLAEVCDLRGEVQAVHRIYLQACYAKPYGDNGNHMPTYAKLSLNSPKTGEALPAKKLKTRYSGASRGAAVQLYPCGEELAVTEGIENALAVRELFGVPVWACLSAGGLKAFQIPQQVKALYIFADNDSNQTGIRAAEVLARRAKLQGIEVFIWQSDTQGNDVLDDLNDIKAAEKAGAITD